MAMIANKDKEPRECPFENYLIVKKLAEISEPAERLKLRQINKFVESVATEVISSCGSPSVRLFDKNSNINSFVKRMKNKNRYKSQIPFTVFNINLASISLPVIKKLTDAIERFTFLNLLQTAPAEGALKLDDIRQILEKVTLLLSKGSKLISLDARVPNWYFFGNSEDLLPSSFPNLKTVYFFCWQSLPNFPCTLFSEIVKRSPNLDKIVINCKPSHRPENLFYLDDIDDALSFEYLPFVLFNCCHTPPKLALSTESLLRPKDIPVLTKMIENGYDKMELLETSFTTYMTSKEVYFQQLPIPELTGAVTALNRLLELQYNSLKVLNLSLSSIGQWERSMQLVLPKLNKLEKLEVKCSNYLQREVQRNLRPLNAFQKGQFPRLKSICLLTQRYELGLFVNIPVFSTVEFASFNIFNTPIEPIPLGIVFPNLKRLEFWVFPPMEMVEDIMSNLVHLEDLDLGSHPTEFLVASQRDAIWNSYTGGAKPLNPKHWADFFQQNGPGPEKAEATTRTGKNSGAGDNQPSKGLGNLLNLRKLCIPIECSQEFHGVLHVLASGKLSSLKEFTQNTRHPEVVIRTKKHPMKWDGQNLTFINSIHRVLTFA